MLPVLRRQSRQIKSLSPGGGRIEYDPEAKKVNVFGFSNSFGQGDHALSKEIILKSMPDCEVTWSNEGY